MVKLARCCSTWQSRVKLASRLAKMGCTPDLLARQSEVMLHPRSGDLPYLVKLANSLAKKASILATRGWRR